MTMWIKGAIAALALAGSAFVAAEPAQARVSIGIGIGGPGYGYDPACDRYSRWYNPYRCDAEYYDDDFYDGPIFIDGFWYDGRWRSRWHHHRREFYFRNHWREGRWDERHHRHRDHDFDGRRGHRHGHW
jgi:hypothetical protein